MKKLILLCLLAGCGIKHSPDQELKTENDRLRTELKTLQSKFHEERLKGSRSLCKTLHESQDLQDACWNDEDIGDPYRDGDAAKRLIQCLVKAQEDGGLI